MSEEYLLQKELQKMTEGSGGYTAFYSDEDEGWICTAILHPGISAFGETRLESMKEFKVAYQLFLDAKDDE